MERKRLRILPPLLIISIALVACGASTAPAPSSPSRERLSLYERLGGKGGVHVIVDAFLKNLLADSRVSAFFRGDKGLPKFEQQICELSGGPCHYVGKNMTPAHRGMGIRGEQFDAFLEDLKRALSDNGVSSSDENELLAFLSPMRGDVVEERTSPARARE